MTSASQVADYTIIIVIISTSSHSLAAEFNVSPNFEFASNVKFRKLQKRVPFTGIECVTFGAGACELRPSAINSDWVKLRVNVWDRG